MSSLLKANPSPFGHSTGYCQPNLAQDQKNFSFRSRLLLSDPERGPVRSFRPHRCDQIAYLAPKGAPPSKSQPTSVCKFWATPSPVSTKIWWPLCHIWPKKCNLSLRFWFSKSLGLSVQLSRLCLSKLFLFLFLFLFLGKFGDPLATFDPKSAICHSEFDFFKVKNCQCGSAASVHPNCFCFCFCLCLCSFHL